MAKSEFLTSASAETKGVLSVFPMSSTRLNEGVFMGMGVPQLLIDGFRYPLNENEAFERTKEFYGTENSTTFFALAGGKAKATFTVTPVTQDGNIERSRRFWGSIARNDPEFLARAEAMFDVSQLSAVHITNAVTHPDWRRMGLQQRLMGQFIDESSPQPHMAFAETRSPSEAALLSEFFYRLNYRTFWGYSEITPNPTLNDHTPSLIARANTTRLGLSYSLNPTFGIPRDPNPIEIHSLEGFSDSMKDKLRGPHEVIASSQPYSGQAIYMPIIILKNELVTLAQQR